MKTYLVTFYNEDGYVVFEKLIHGTYSYVWNEALLKNYNDFIIKIYKPY